MSVAVTFSGRYGDILWSLPTAREIAKIHGPVDFFMMKDFEGIAPLLNSQPYIAQARGLDGWNCLADGCGAQPREHPPISGYTQVFDLTYPCFPHAPLVDFIAIINRISFTQPVIPFLTTEPSTVQYDLAVSLKFRDKMEIFFKPLVEALEARLNRHLTYVETELLPWDKAASAIAASRLFVGDKSSNQVMAHGVCKPVLIYETNRDRV